jgi:hypothetical protein
VSSRDVFLIEAALLIIIALLIGLLDSRERPQEVPARIGQGAITGAIVGAVSLLVAQSDKLVDVQAIRKGALITQGTQLTKGKVVHLGEQLVADSVIAGAVVLLALALFVWEIRWGIDARKGGATWFRPLCRFIMVGLVPAVALGAGALYLVYLRS